MTDYVVTQTELHQNPPELWPDGSWPSCSFRPGTHNPDPGSSASSGPAASPAQSLADTWQGTLQAGRDLRTVVKISKADGGGYKAVFYSIDQGGGRPSRDNVTLDGATVKMTLKMIGGT